MMDLGLKPDGDDALVFSMGEHVSSAADGLIQRKVAASTKHIPHSPIYVDGHVSYNQHIHSVYYVFSFCT